MVAIVRIDHLEQGLAKRIRRFGITSRERTLDAADLRGHEPCVQLAAFRRQIEQPLAPIARAFALIDEALVDEIAQDAAEALFGDAQDVKQFGDVHARIAANEVDDAVVGAAEAVVIENVVGIGDEVAIGKEQQFDERNDLRRWIIGRCRRLGIGRMLAPTIQDYVSHIDIF